MLVGEVRCATIARSGASWTLSGGRPWSDAAANVSK